jgi:hypothetical protein
MYLIVDKFSKEIKMVSENIIEVDTDIFDIVEHNESWDLFKNGGYNNVGYSMKYVDNEIEKIPVNKETIQKEIKSDLENATTMDDLKLIINKIIK